MKKKFLSAQGLLTDSFLLGKQVLESEFRPDFIVGVWRGGTPVGIAIQEMLSFFSVCTDHIAVRTSLYRGIDTRDEQVRVHGLDYLVNNMSHTDSLLIVDDVFDSGRSIEAIFEALATKMRRNLPAQIKVATPWFKPNKNETGRKPDFYLHETDDWLVFPHELVGLSLAEIKADKAALAQIMQSVKCESNPLA